MHDPDTIFRVLRLTTKTVDAFKAARVGSTNRETIRQLVDEHLPKLIERLESVGVIADQDKRRVVRLPIPTATLDSLKEASERTGLPSSLLLQVCMKSGKRVRQRATAKRRTRKAKVE